MLAFDLTGDEAGAVAVLISVLEGTDHIPLQPIRSQLRSLGAAAATFHQLPLRPTTDLPRRDRPMPWIDFTLERSRGAFPTTALLERADDVLRAAGSVSDEVVFVHGDLWAGNTMWRDDAYVGTFDFEAAGAGSCGVDLGSLRLDAAMLYHQAAADEILAGWEAESGRAAPEVAFWDITAAANTNADMSGAVPTMHQAGRTDLDGPTLTARREAFLEAALTRLEGG